MAKEDKTVELKEEKPKYETATSETRVVITEDRYVDGQYIRASVDEPKVLLIPKGYKIDSGMTKEADYSDQKLVPHYAVAGTHPQSVKRSAVEIMPADTTPKRAHGQLDKVEYEEGGLVDNKAAAKARASDTKAI